MESSKPIKANEKNVRLEEERKNRRSYWGHLLNQYEKRNATLEKRQFALAERVKFMECALPSLLLGAMINNSQDSKDTIASSRTCHGTQECLEEKEVTE